MSNCDFNPHISLYIYSIRAHGVYVEYYLSLSISYERACHTLGTHHSLYCGHYSSTTSLALYTLSLILFLKQSDLNVTAILSCRSVIKLYSASISRIYPTLPAYIYIPISLVTSSICSHTIEISDCARVPLISSLSPFYMDAYHHYLLCDDIIIYCAHCSTLTHDRVPLASRPSERVLPL